MSRERTASGVSLLVAIGALAGIGCDSTARSARGSGDVVAPTSASATPAQVTSGRTRGYVLGRRYDYAFEIATSVSFDGASKDVSYDLTGTVEIVPVVVGNDMVELRAALRGVRIGKGVPAPGAELAALATELGSSSATFELKAGLLDEFAVPASLGAVAAGTYRQIAAALQFVHVTGAVERYSAEEHDTTGRYVADYERLAEAGSFRKRKRHYVALLGDTGTGDARHRIVPEVVRSFGEVRLSPDGRPMSVKLADEVVVHANRMPVRSTITIELESVREIASEDPLSGQGELSGLRRYGANEVIVDASVEEALARARIGKLDFDTILKRLEAIARERKPVVLSEAAQQDATDPEEQAERSASVEEDARLFAALTAIFRTKPDTVTRAAAAIRRKSPAADALMDALGSTSTREAHRTLRTLLSSEEVGSDVQARLVFALARTRNPTEEATEALRAVVARDPFHPGALYGLGTHARLFRDQGRPSEASAIGRFLLERLERAEGASSLGVVLRAIANSGYDAALPLVTPYLSDQREEVRKAAVRALQSMQTAEVDALIAQRIEADSSKEVRLSAIQAARLRTPSDVLVTALSAAGATAAEPHVRFRAVELLARWLPERPGLRPALEQIAKADVESHIRERALAAL
jgi:hypothetical protein